MKRSLPVVVSLLALLLVACVSRQERPDATNADNASLHSDLIRSLLAQGQFYAALAHVEDQQRITGDNDELRGLRADAYAALGRGAEAETLYRSLLNGRYAGDGYHGLGLLYARRDPATALGYLRAAVKARPTRAEWRNDLGYALISAGKPAAALPEMATAVELSPDTEKYRNNLLILLILMKDESGISRLTRQWNLSTASLGDLRQQAQTLAKPLTARPATKPRGGS